MAHFIMDFYYGKCESQARRNKDKPIKTAGISLKTKDFTETH